jgi:hypothetical protein
MPAPPISGFSQLIRDLLKLLLHKAGELQWQIEIIKNFLYYPSIATGWFCSKPDN